jgi:hypothetical protein
LVGSRGAVELAGDGEDLGELVCLEEATGGPIRLEATSLASCRVAREQSVLDRRVQDIDCD